MTYHDDTSRVSSSSLKLFARAPILWKMWRDGTLTDERSPALTFGSLLHCLQFEPQNMSAVFAFKNDDAPKKPTKTQLAAWERFRNLAKPTKAQIEANEKTTEIILFWGKWNETNAGKDEIDQDDINEAQGCLAGLQSDPRCRQLLALPGPSELVVEWVDEATGLPCKAKLDRLTRSCIIDLKTASDASVDGFKRAAFERGYHRQAAWYIDGVTTALKQGTLAPEAVALLSGEPPDLFVFPVVEKDAQKMAHCFVATEHFIQRGRDENTLLMKELKTCIDSNNWPGLCRDTSGMTPLDVPGWAKPIEPNKIIP